MNVMIPIIPMFMLIFPPSNPPKHRKLKTKFEGAAPHIEDLRCGRTSTEVHRECNVDAYGKYLSAVYPSNPPASILQHNTIPLVYALTF